MPLALLSVSDKAGLPLLAEGLRRLGYTLVSTGGTLRALRESGLEVTAVSDLTGFPEILDGRVKTLHPAVHAGVLARPTAEHRKELHEHGLQPIDVVVVNLYPFRETVARPESTFQEVVEQIDIGGPTLLRAAAKNVERVWSVVDPRDYDRLLQSLERGEDDGLRLELAAKAFAHTATYDAAIASFLERSRANGERTGANGERSARRTLTGDDPLPERLVLSLERASFLRYGENPHLRAGRYRESGTSGWWDSALQHKGSDLSYLNMFDAEAAWRLVFEFTEPACVVVKHANPCGVAVAAEISDAYGKAFAADPKSAFGGVVAFNRRVEPELAEAIMANAKADLLIAPEFDSRALEILSAKRKAMRVLSAGRPGTPELELRRISGGFLVQEPDVLRVDRSNWRVVTRRTPSESEWRDLELAWRVCARTSSNAIVLAKDRVAVGIGAGQQSRVDAAELAARKAGGRAVGGACASDAFYPFRDGLDAAAEAGVAAVIQPGGSVRDDEVIDAANEHGLAMVLTGRRHFRH